MMRKPLCLVLFFAAALPWLSLANDGGVLDFTADPASILTFARETVYAPVPEPTPLLIDAYAASLPAPRTLPHSLL